ncbi:MAG: hypothetical protein ABI480_13855 [Chitinophagaceae bacterium]
MKYSFTLLSCFLCFTILSAQSSLPNIKIHLNVEAHGEHHYNPYFAAVSMPGMIKEQRRYNPDLNISYDSLTDNPLRHGAMYVALKTRTDIGRKVQLNADLYGEYRGFSYGTFNDNNTVIYPVMSVTFNDSFRIKNNSLLVNVNVGQFLNERSDEGLMIYNIDLQGTKIKFRYQQSEFAVKIYGDMENAIGLDVDDYISFSYTHFFKQDSAAVGTSYVIAAPSGTPPKYHTYHNIFGHLHTKRGIQYYAQLSFTENFARTQDYFRGIDRQIAALIGVAMHKQHKKFSINQSAEIRYYGSVYNFFHSDRTLRYRKPAHDIYELYDNTIGRYLYPLRKFNTPFSQWAVFTEYFSHPVTGLALSGDLTYKLFPAISLRLDYDINAIHSGTDEHFNFPDKSSDFIYPFFKASTRYSPVEGVYVGFFVSNKSMNLDVGYPTQYLVSKPFAGIEFHITQ